MTGRERALVEDLRARLAAQQVFDRPIVVEAGAGTGKTSILVARAVAWCLGPGWVEARAAAGVEAGEDEVAARVVGGVVAITFTEAAAAEMANRVAQALADLAGGRTPIGVADEALPTASARAERARRVLAQVHRLRIRTIHSLCSGLLQRFPVEAGVDPAFTVDADGSALESAVRLALEEAVREALVHGVEGDGPDPRWLELAVAGIGPTQVADAVAVLAEEGVDPGLLQHDPGAMDHVRVLGEELSVAARELLEAEGGRLLGVSGSPRTTATRQEVAALQVALGGPPPGELETLLEAARQVSEKGLERLQAWGRQEWNRTEAAALGADTCHVAAAARRLRRTLVDLAELDPRRLELVRPVVGGVLAGVHERLRSAGVVSFQGLLTGAQDLLVASPWVRALLRREVRQLLVDEFQDTDRVQCEVVRRLALEGPAGDRPGLFIVGDPKQSIYGWRDADLRAYDAFVDEVLAAGGLRLHLTVNYRSVPAVLDEVTRVVERVMVEERGLQPPFQVLNPCPGLRGEPGFNVPPWSVVEHWAAWPMVDGVLDLDSRTGPALELEATAVARDLVRLHRREGVRWGAVGLLLRATSDVDVLLTALREHGVPYTVARERQYFRRREVAEAAALIRCVLHPWDQLALLTVLRSDVVGVPDAALLPLWQEGFPDLMAGMDGPQRPVLAAVRRAIRRAAGRVPRDVPGLDRLPEWVAATVAAAENLAVLRASLATEAADRFVERVRSLWLAEATAAARSLGRHRHAGVERFFAELETRLLAAEGSRTDLARFLRQAVEHGVESRDPVSPEGGGEAVQVMTIHGAKGLDFEHVYLLQLHRTRPPGRQRQQTRVLRHGDGVELLLCGAPTPGYLRARRWEERVAAAEQVRLLYVAMTRAKVRLVLSGRWPALPDAFPVVAADSLLELVAHRAPPGEPAAQADAALARRTDEHGVQWVLPALSHGEPVAPVPTVQLRPAAAARVWREAAALRLTRTAAAERMRRPATAAASTEARRLLAREGRALELAEERGGGGGRDVALAVGTAIHGLLERLDLGGDLAAELEQGATAAEEEFERQLPPDVLAAARQRLGDVLGGLRGGRCLARLAELAGAVVARELPLLLPPADDPGAPVGFVAGAADLVYRDPVDGGLVVADYKTDLLHQDDDVSERAVAYTPQVQLYARALQDALDLPDPPAAELWFLAVDRILRVGSGAERATAGGDGTR